MNNSKESRSLVRQNEKTVQKSHKHDANLQKNSTLYFQIGLILCLLASYTALEATFAIKADVYTMGPVEDHTIYEIVQKKFVIEEKVKEKKPEPIKKPKKSDQIKAVDNDTKIEKAIEDILVITKPTKPVKVVDTDDPLIDVVEVEETVNILAVQKVPIYPGCEKAKNNNERRKCMSDKLSKLIQRKFNGDLGAELGLRGKQKILVAFKINKNGDVEIEKVRAPHDELEKEAIRVVNKIPQMEPGKNNKKPVNVSYMLPITFKVH
ncbi:energy transducer TonB [uncultured Lacinutrix sp.]|uniref:energy transducer TonB n=1 Tax=uncultured Lacinutrix sp. TaxID=574032 RepID=UPI0026346954|nr:energy transducer TonB [uncultured Lacinutrix sp.]